MPLVDSKNSYKPQLIGKYDVTQIFAKSEDISTEKEYSYSEQKPIVGKASLVFSGEGLRKYTLPIKVHYSYCDPGQIINDLEKKAEAKAVISYYQQGEYIGEYVISRIKKNIVTRHYSKILYAEIEVDLLENPIDELNYTQKSNPNEELFNNAKQDVKPSFIEPIEFLLNQNDGQSLFDKLTSKAYDYALGQVEDFIDDTVTELLNG